MADRSPLFALLIALAAPTLAPAEPPPAFEEIPKIDVHSHVFEDVPEVVEMMDRCRVRIVNVCVRGTDPERLRRQEELAERRQAQYGRGRFGAHLGSLEYDVDELGRRFDRYPNFSVDCSARTADLTRQPRDKVRAFLLRYPDRVLYGLDRSYRPDPQRESTAEDRLRFARDLEASYRQDFRYYAGEGEMEYRGRTVRCLGLPREILEKLYHRNAERLIPGLE
jgi:predicted TIM-barrel fold metal-dependent hydrolase